MYGIVISLGSLRRVMPLHLVHSTFRALQYQLHHPRAASIYSTIHSYIAPTFNVSRIMVWYNSICIHYRFAIVRYGFAIVRYI